jgi:hypothetical protein
MRWIIPLIKEVDDDTKGYVALRERNVTVGVFASAALNGEVI